MKTEALIRELALDIQPVKPLSRPVVRFLRWALFATAWVVTAVLVVGTRIDVGRAVRDSAFLLRLALPVALGVAAAITAFVRSVPDRKSPLSAIVPGALLAAWLLLILVEISATGGGHVGIGFKCARNIVAFSVPPGVLLYFMLMRAAPLDRGAIGLRAALVAEALAHAGTCFICRNHGGLHMLVWHVGFVLLLAGAGILVGRALFK